MITVAITGNIGSGKTFVADILKRMNYPVYEADREAVRLMNKPEVIMRIADRFGLEILAPDGLIDRKKLAERVFYEPGALQWLNQVIHPLVMQHWMDWASAHADSVFVFLESAIIFEHNLQQFFDAVIFVDAPRNTAIQRVILRDHTDAGSVEARMLHQWPAEKKRALADAVIENDGGKLIMPQLLSTLDLLKKRFVGV